MGVSGGAQDGLGVRDSLKEFSNGGRGDEEKRRVNGDSELSSCSDWESRRTEQKQ